MANQSLFHAARNSIKRIHLVDVTRTHSLYSNTQPHSSLSVFFQNLSVSTLTSCLSKWLRYCVFFLCFMYLICIDYNGNPLLVFSNSLLLFSFWKLEFAGAEGDLEGLDHDRWQNKAESNRSCSWYIWYLIFMSMFSLTVFHILIKKVLVQNLKSFLVTFFKDII